MLRHAREYSSRGQNMDIATLIGLFLGMSLVGYAIFTGAGAKANALSTPSQP